MREHILLECPVCKSRLYSSTKNKKKHTERLELKKFCKICRRHEPHKEVK
ncbi:MAG TPA: 50S ribosomal protein L33 [Candidatus Omnitrophica bacterium]|nr:50S ribosomal protein L33 [Candidatus Omnitrophota bacterium]